MYQWQRATVGDRESAKSDVQLLSLMFAKISLLAPLYSHWSGYITGTSPVIVGSQIVPYFGTCYMTLYCKLHMYYI